MEVQHGAVSRFLNPHENDRQQRQGSDTLFYTNKKVRYKNNQAEGMVKKVSSKYR